MSTALQLARAALQTVPASDFEAFTYLRSSSVQIAHIVNAIGFYAVTDIQDCGAGRFDFADDGERAFVMEAFGADGETVVDLVAWPLSDPTRVLSMYGKCGLLGVDQALNPSTFFVGGRLTVHRTPLDWLRAGCVGAAVVTPHVAARDFLDAPGRFLVADVEHGKQIARLMSSLVDEDRIGVARAA